MATTVLEMDKRNEAAENLKLELKRVIRASRQSVFDAWTRPETIRLWFGPEGKQVGEVAADARVGGGYSIAMLSTGCAGTPGGGTETVEVPRPSSASGRYLRVEPYDLLQFTWIGSWDPTVESLITLRFTDVADGTELSFLQEKFSSEESRSQHTFGWAGSFEKLQRLLEA